jgi:hypothetical protein
LTTKVAAPVSWLLFKAVPTTILTAFTLTLGVNRFTLSLLKQHPGKDSIVMKRRACGWNENFMLEVLTGATI